jgi:8-oxo-dGTP diphosphatase
MPAPYCYEYPRPAVTVDLAALARSNDGLRVLLIRRKHDPFAGRWALPGGFLEIDEPIDDAARRELKEETGLEVAGSISFLGVFGDPGRDPRGRTISIAYLAILQGLPPGVAGADDAEEAAWLDPWEVKELAFDHGEILHRALLRLAATLANSEVALNLLPAEFDLGEVRRLFDEAREAHLVTTPPRWLEREIRMKTIEPVPGRPGWYRRKT